MGSNVSASVSVTPTTRAQVVTRRTYNRPLSEDGKVFETWEETVSRVISHQRWLWERAVHRELNQEENNELRELQELLLSRAASMSGRTLWLGGTDVAKTREASMFNCSFGEIETIHDVVDSLWLLLQGCGVGFHPRVGTLNGFTKHVDKIEVIRSTRTEKSGIDANGEDWNPTSKTWTIRVGDSAEAWAKSIGKLLAGKHPADKLVLDLSAIRPAGERLKGYGWISSGDDQIARAFTAIAELLNRRAGTLLTRIDLLDLENWLGTILSSRRSAEIALFNYGEPEWEEFSKAKQELDPMNPLNPQRTQSNNSLVFKQKPSREELENIFDMMVEAGGSEPGFINAEAATKRAPWFRGVNPCAEILLGNKSFCNLTETNLTQFMGEDKLGDLEDAIWLIARANYRQTLVNLDDGVLQRAWHENNEFLRLTGVGLTGIASWIDSLEPDLVKYALAGIRKTAVMGVDSMADELGTPRSKMVTTVKPSGTLSKIMGTDEFGEVPEGVHRPLGKYIFNNVNFSKHDPLLDKLTEAGYRTFENPYDPDAVAVAFPVMYDKCKFTKLKDGREVNLETAIDQLERYKLMMVHYVQHNCSVTISYDPHEVPEIIDWIMDNWDIYVGVSFIFRNDPTKTAADLGYAYLPQEVVTKEAYDEYVARLKPVDIDAANSHEELRDDECAGGACPIR